MEQAILSRIETEVEVKSYLRKINYALDNGAKIDFQLHRFIDGNRDVRYTNAFTVSDLFPDEKPQEALSRELRTLTIENYIRTLKDTRYINRSELREFGKVYKGKNDVYIKIRVDLLPSVGNNAVFVMSFHYAMIPFTKNTFPYKGLRGQ